MPSDPIRRRVVVHGRVQGVFFRDSVRERAQAAGVGGWARNLPDGAVEIVIEGPATAVEQLQRYCETGPEHAQVEAAQVNHERPEGLSGFEISG